MWNTVSQSQLGIGNTGNNIGVAFADFDGDGDLDIYLPHYGVNYDSNRLLRNNGDGSFTDISTAAGM